jgi:hypothetical protein
VLIERHDDMAEAAFAPTLDLPRLPLRVGAKGRCAYGRLPLPSEGGALVAYVRVS